MIQQHFYTRGRHGYNTVAKSAGLSDDFIKKNIHPYCVYGGVDALTVAHFPCGKMLFGKATRLPADFTGQRAAFFMHNYIFPPEKVGGFLTEIGDFLHTQFESSFDSDKLAEIKDLQRTKHTADAPLTSLPNTILHIADCAIESVRKSKKTYVILPPDISEIDALTQIYAHLPDATKHRLGFCSHAAGPEKRKNIHLIFTRDKPISGDFVVDMKIGSGSNTNRTNSEENPDTHITSHLPTLPPEKIHTEAAFWLARTPYLREEITLAEAAWLEKNLATLTPRQILATPPDFIKRGKNGENPEIYVQLSILKSALKNSEIPLRYLLGSYSLSPEIRERTEQNLRRICQKN